MIRKWKDEWVEVLLDLKSKGHSNSTIAIGLNSKFSDYTFTEVSVESKLRRLKDKTKKDNDDTTKLENAPSGKVFQEHKILANGEQSSSILIAMNEKQKKSPDFLLEAHGFDHDKWQVKSATSNVWEQAQDKPVYQSKITVAPRVAKFDPETALSLLKKTVKPYKVSHKNIHLSEDALVLPLADLHFGITKLDDVKDKLDKICSYISEYKFKKVVIEQLGDLFHSDQMNQAITKNGTNLDDVDMQSAIVDGKTFYTTIIKSALEVGSAVEIKHTQGNHSGDLEYLFLMYIEAVFPTIDVQYNIDYRTAYQLTDHVGIMLAHGDVAKKQLPMLFAGEYPEIWSHSKYREIHTGHFHKEVVSDESGVVKRQFGTPKKPDPYERKNGYTMAYHKLEMLVYGVDCLKEIVII